jgi:hypothetical protein
LFSFFIMVTKQIKNSHQTLSSMPGRWLAVDGFMLCPPPQAGWWDGTSPQHRQQPISHVSSSPAGHTSQAPRHASSAGARVGQTTLLTRCTWREEGNLDLTEHHRQDRVTENRPPLVWIELSYQRIEKHCSESSFRHQYTMNLQLAPPPSILYAILRHPIEQLWCLLVETYSML